MNLTSERWQRVARIYELAVSQDEARRDAFLAEVCAADQELRCEVESLLRQDDQSIILDHSLWTTAAPLFREVSDLRPGTSLGPYRIESFIGAGGMGEVFRATDTRLNRHVAVKVVSPTAAPDDAIRARFASEARAIAALTHPHICTLFDVGRHDGVDFLVMEHLEGETLAARLACAAMPLQEALTHALDIASALDHAHGHGVVHRDLKPANVMLTASGAKLLDFGVAKFRSMPGAVTSADANTAGRSGGVEGEEGHVSRAGAVLGTARYMAPEQIEGRDVDGRSDLFSFGAVMFEMLTGERAFVGDDPITVRTAILHHEPPAVSSCQPHLPAAIDDVVRRCLSKHPAERWQSASEVIAALRPILDSTIEAAVSGPRPNGRWEPRRVRTFAGGILFTILAALGAWAIAAGLLRWSSRAGAGEIRSVAVLPLQSVSGDPDEEYFADGTTERLIANLATVNRIRTISRMSVMHYKHQRVTVPMVARELGVDAIVEGSIAAQGDTVRITARLVRGVSGDIVWSQSFTAEQRHVLGLTSEIAQAILTNIGITLTPPEQARLAAARSVDPEVDREVLLGRHHAAKGTEEGLRKAVHYFEAAVAREPTNASAHAGMAEAYTELAGFYLDPREAMPKAKRAAETALRLDEGLAEAHAALGYVQLVYDWNGPAAATSLLRALDLNPTLGAARLNYASYLTTQGRNDEAVEEIHRAIYLDPVSIRTHTVGTSLLLFTRRYDDAVELARKGLELEPDSAFTLAFQGIAYAEQGHLEQAVANLQRAAALDDSLTILALQAHVLAAAGRKSEAATILRRVQESAKHQYFCPYEIATVYVTLGDHDAAYDLFRKGTNEHADCMAWLGVEPWIDSFRSDPRYPRLLREIGLTPPVPQQ